MDNILPLDYPATKEQDSRPGMSNMRPTIMDRQTKAIRDGLQDAMASVAGGTVLPTHPRHRKANNRGVMQQNQPSKLGSAGLPGMVWSGEGKHRKSCKCP